jgi:hypothetical protein
MGGQPGASPRAGNLIPKFPGGVLPRMYVQRAPAFAARIRGWPSQDGDQLQVDRNGGLESTATGNNSGPT